MKKVLAFLIVAASLSSQPTELPKKHIYYTSLSGRGILEEPLFFPEFSLGIRGFPAKATYDFRLGSSQAYCYTQASCLYYPNPHLYLGAGLSIYYLYTSDFSFFPVLPNIPLTLGYQFDSHQFIEFQASPIVPTYSFSYGFGF